MSADELLQMPNTRREHASRRLPAGCHHDIVFTGNMNLLNHGEIVGAIDIWNCRKCRHLFCEDKRWGLTELAPEIGFPELAAGAKWAVLVCHGRHGLRWKLVGARAGATVEHECQSNTPFIRLGNNFQPVPGGEAQHRLYLVEDFVNSECEVGGEIPA